MGETLFPPAQFSAGGMIPITLQQRLFLRARSFLTGFPIFATFTTLTADGRLVPSRLAVTPTSAGDAVIEAGAAVPGWIVAVVIHTDTAAVRRGEAYAQAGVLTGGSAIANLQYLLAQGWVYDGGGPFWPNGLQEPINAPDLPVQAFNLTTPGAGSDFSEPIPSNELWEIHSVTFRLQTDATTGNRTVILETRVTAQPRRQFLAFANMQAENATVRYSFAANGGHPEASLAVGLTSAPMPVLYGEPGERFFVNILGIESGDQLDEGRLFLRRYMM